MQLVPACLLWCVSVCKCAPVCTLPLQSVLIKKTDVGFNVLLSSTSSLLWYILYLTVVCAFQVKENRWLTKNYPSSQNMLTSLNWNLQGIFLNFSSFFLNTFKRTLEFIYQKKIQLLIVTLLLFDYHFCQTSQKSHLPVGLRS